MLADSVPVGTQMDTNCGDTRHTLDTVFMRLGVNSGELVVIGSW